MGQWASNWRSKLDFKFLFLLRDDVLSPQKESGSKLTYFKNFNNLGLEFPILGGNPDFKDDLDFGGDSARGARLHVSFLLFLFIYNSSFIYLF